MPLAYRQKHFLVVKEINTFKSKVGSWIYFFRFKCIVPPHFVLNRLEGRQEEKDRSKGKV